MKLNHKTKTFIAGVARAHVLYQTAQIREGSEDVARRLTGERLWAHLEENVSKCARQMEEELGRMPSHRRGDKIRAWAGYAAEIAKDPRVAIVDRLAVKPRPAAAAPPLPPRPRVYPARRSAALASTLICAAFGGLLHGPAAQARSRFEQTSRLA